VVGDVDFESVLPEAGWLTPVPGRCEGLRAKVRGWALGVSFPLALALWSHLLTVPVA
jgi:hypothetical protein